MTELTKQFERCRQQFPALARQVNGNTAIYLDGPGGTQVPQCVIDAVSHYLSNMNANHEGLFATSMESDRLLAEAHRAMADFVGSNDPDTIVFGANMTSLTFALARSLAKTWQPGDEVIVTRLDHDANVRPWVMAAEDAGAIVRFVGFHTEDCTLDLDDLKSQISDKTKLVAVGCASNATGNINPVEDICRWAHEAGALVFLDAVHFAPHALIDVARWDCDFLACSAYKFFGPHIGLLWGRRELLEQLVAYRVRPAPDSPPGKWMTGTQNHEGIAGALAAVDYLANLGRLIGSEETVDRRLALRIAFDAITEYEGRLVARLLKGLAAIPEITVWGITDEGHLDHRLPTISLTHDRIETEDLARQLGELGIFAWHGNYYALELTEALGLEPQGMVRLGLVHYNTMQEVERVLEVFEQIS